MLFTALLSGQFGSQGRGVSIAPPFRFRNLRYMHLADRVSIERDCWILVHSPKTGCATPSLVIGAFSGIGMGATISVVQQVVLGRYVMLARNVYISDHGHAFEDVSKPIALQGLRTVKRTLIDDETWLGQNVCVLPGVRIGKHCVIGANSTVTCDIPDFCVAVGSPAKVIKKYDPGKQLWLPVS
jgi:acetyltransferase-like isoleucine patch superfamily enzyme